jgi:hypothetical protein
MSYYICQFPGVKVEPYWKNDNYWRLLQNHCITLSNIVLKYLNYTPIGFSGQAKDIHTYSNRLPS